MISDIHLHTEFSGDSNTPVHAQIEQAIRLGMEEICITDHHDYDVISEIDFTLDIPRYVEEITRVREEYKDRIHVNLGIELGLQCHLKEYLEQLAGRYPFDFIIGSSHFVNRIDPYYPAFYEGKSEDEAYRGYFEATLKRLSLLDCYDSVGHEDYVVRYGPNKNRFYTYEKFADVLDEILKTIIRKGKALECNTGGYKYRLGEPNPSVAILKRYRELGGERITIGSDAHRPEEMGFEFAKAREVLLGCGYEYYCVYRGREAQMRRL